jgi:ppGpp synthetase/RelA/SpoT-type nucleotidyltranferase
MIISPPIRQEYNRINPYVQILYTNVRSIILNYCSLKNFAFTDRIKTIDSLSEKIETGRFRKWSDIEDFYAATIIIPNLNIEKEVIVFLQTTFDKIELKKRGDTLKSPDVFRFESTRFIGRLKQSGEQTELSKINFEIQIKTAFEHAWSVSTHSLVYKANDIDWKLLRIASQLKSSVEQLDVIVSSAKQMNSNIIEHKWPEINIKKHILDQTNEFLKNLNVPEELKPKDSSRFSENLYSFFYPYIKDSKKPFKLLEPFFLEANNFANTLEKEKFPRSISLIQYFIGVADSLNYNFENEKYVPLITPEMETIFPKVKKLKKRFEI